MLRFMMPSDGAPKPLSFDPRREVGPVLASASTTWAGIPFEIHDLPAADGVITAGPVPGDRGMMIILDGTLAMSLSTSRSQRPILMPPGQINFAEGGHVPAARVAGRARAMVFSLTPIWHERLMLDGGPESFARLPPIAAHETARALGHTIASEVKSGAISGALFAESLSVALLRYVSERLPSRAMRVRGSLSDAQRRRLARYIDEHLHEDIALTEIAQFVGLSLRHFSTLFRTAFGLSPHQYIIQRRLELGARLLSSSGADIAAIALHVGFSSQSHFATAFRKKYGMSPRRYAVSRRSTVSDT